MQLRHLWRHTISYHGKCIYVLILKKTKLYIIEKVYILQWDKFTTSMIRYYSGFYLPFTPEESPPSSMEWTTVPAHLLDKGWRHGHFTGDQSVSRSSHFNRRTVSKIKSLESLFNSFRSGGFGGLETLASLETSLARKAMLLISETF